MKHAPRGTLVVESTIKQIGAAWAPPRQKMLLGIHQPAQLSTPASAESWTLRRVVSLHATSADLPVEQLFSSLADQWERETGPYSFLYDKAMHWAYQRIIGLGPEVIPFIFKRLEERPGHWYWALESLTGADPAQDAETTSEAREAWLAWGHEHFYIP